MTSPADEQHELDELKDIFVRGLAHELSSPLHAIQGLLELVDERTDDPEIRASAHAAARAAARLNLSLRGLLDFAALRAGDDEVRNARVRLGAYVDRVVDRWRLPAARAGLLLVGDLGVDGSTVVEVDEARIDQIVDALLDNAIRFGGTPINLLIETSEAIDVLRIEVRDHGPGVAHSQWQLLLQPFERGQDATGGFGVGLTLAHEVTELLGGTIEFLPTDGGATVVVEVPLVHDHPDS